MFVVIQQIPRPGDLDDVAVYTGRDKDEACRLGRRLALAHPGSAVTVQDGAHSVSWCHRFLSTWAPVPECDDDGALDNVVALRGHRPTLGRRPGVTEPRGDG